MPRKSRMHSGKSGNGPAASGIKFRGRFVAPEDRGTPVLVRLSYVTHAVTTSVASVATLNNVFDTSAINSTSRWSSLKGIYQEWRPVGQAVTFVPHFRNAFVSSNTTTAGYDQQDSMSPLYLCPYKGASTALSTELNAVEHQHRIVGSLNQQLKAVVRMDEADEASWVSTSTTTPGAVMGVKSWCQYTTAGATDIVSFGTFIVDIMVQFRFPVATSLQKVTDPPGEEAKAPAAAGCVADAALPNGETRSGWFLPDVKGASRPTGAIATPEMSGRPGARGR